jgi:hypothetical protein
VNTEREMSDVGDYCEGCGAVVDQEHLADCSVYLEQLRSSAT